MINNSDSDVTGSEVAVASSTSSNDVTGSEVAVASSTSSNVAVVGPETPITKIWEDKAHIKKCERNGKKGWQCLWCQVEWTEVSF